MKNFEIGAEIRDILMDNSALTESLTMVTDGVEEVKIYPIIANSDATFPFLIYRRQSYTPDSNKDYSSEKVNLEFYLCSTKYSESVDLIDMTCDTLRGKETDIIEDIKITNLYEDYINDTFVQYASMEVVLKD